MNYEFNSGGVWDNNNFTIATDYKTEADSGNEMCKHCHSKKETVRYSSDPNDTYTVSTWVVPFVIIAYNEGGHNSTGVCIECIIEALNTIKQ